MLTAVIFDLDETLIDREATMQAFLAQQHGRFNEHLSCGALQFSAQVLKLQAGGYAEKYDAYRSALSQLGQDVSLAEKLMPDFEDRYGNEAIAFDGAADVVNMLKTQFKTGLITNGRSRGQRHKIQSAGFDGLFDAITISEEVGIKKPDVRIFEHCMRQLSISAQEAIYIGDNPDNDIVPARRMGMKTVWLFNTRFEPPQAVDAVVRDITRLPEVVAAL